MKYSAFAIVKYCASHNVKLSVPLTPAGASLAEGILHAPKVCLSCRKAHLVRKKSLLSDRQNLVKFGQCPSEVAALPL